MMSSSRLSVLRLGVLLLASFALTSVLVHRAEAQEDPNLQKPACHPCIDKDNCYVIEKNSYNLTKVDDYKWTTKAVKKENLPYLSVAFSAPGSDDRYIKFENDFDLDAIVAIHYMVKGSQSPKEAKVALYKANGNEDCKGSAPKAFSPLDIVRIDYEYPDLRS